jgi:putative colanic acid biosynthesis acetyltransferase WcaF
MLLWEYTWVILCLWTPKPFNPWRLIVLKVFGAKIDGHPFVHQRARIQIPWNVELHDGTCIGDRANLYSLDRICIGEGAVVAQEAYLCTGTHDLADPALPLLTAPLTIGAHSFIGARAFVMPGVSIGANAVIGACSVVTRDVAPSAVVRGNPAR